MHRSLLASYLSTVLANGKLAQALGSCTGFISFTRHPLSSSFKVLSLPPLRLRMTPPSFVLVSTSPFTLKFAALHEINIT